MTVAMPARSAAAPVREAWGLGRRRRAGGGGTTFPARARPAGITTSFPSLVRTAKNPASACSRMPSTSVICLLSAGPGRQRITTRLPTSAQVSRTSSRYHMPVTCSRGRRLRLPGSRPGARRRSPCLRRRCTARRPRMSRAAPPTPGYPMPLLDSLKYRGMECEHLGGHPAGRAADLTCRAEGVLRGRPLEAPVGLPQAPDAVAGLAADLRGHRRHDLLDLHLCLCALADDAAPRALEDLGEGDAVRVDPLMAGQPHDDPGQAVMHRQMRPYLLVHQLRVRGPGAGAGRAGTS